MPHKNSLLAPSRLLTVTDSSEVGEVRRFAQAAAEDLGFDETRAGEVAIVATELATNLLRHAGGGQIVGRISGDGEDSILDLLSLDKGPGIRDVARAMQDGYSTRGGAGTGLGAMSRLADVFDLHSVPGVGTAVLARFGGTVAEPNSIETGALSLPYPGEQVCGDAWEIGRSLERCSIAVIDGLGHGIDAGLAAQEAVRVIAAQKLRTPEQVLESVHGALRHTRGAAMALAEIDLGSRLVRYAGVGNIVGATAFPGVVRRMVSFDGTVGHEVHKIQGFDYVLEPGHVLIMHSDGIRSHWQLDRYPGLLTRDTFLIAGVLYRDYFKGNDDATVVVARVAAP